MQVCYLGHATVSSPLVQQSQGHHGGGLDAMGDLDLDSGGGQQRGHVDAHDLGHTCIHRAPPRRSKADEKPNARRVVALLSEKCWWGCGVILEKLDGAP